MSGRVRGEQDTRRGRWRRRQACTSLGSAAARGLTPVAGWERREARRHGSFTARMMLQTTLRQHSAYPAPAWPSDAGADSPSDPSTANRSVPATACPTPTPCRIARMRARALGRGSWRGVDAAPGRVSGFLARPLSLVPSDSASPPSSAALPSRRSPSRAHPGMNHWRGRVTRRPVGAAMMRAVRMPP